jgi:DNA-binding transcriptional regulator YiaG
LRLPRQTRGAAHPAARLTPQEVQRIRQEYVRYRQPLRCFAARYGVHVSTVWRVIQHYTYLDEER